MQLHSKSEAEFNQIDYAFVSWYYGLFGDQWRLIADILNYHPLTRGRMRHKEYIQQLYYMALDG